MLTISKPLSATQAQTYHAKEFTAAEQNYWKQNDTIQGEWHGRLAEKFGLAGSVGAAEFARLSEGQHPETGEQLVRHRRVHEYKTEDGKTVAPVEHRAGWDATFSAPKSVSLTALVGGDDRVREAHQQAVNAALNELERYTQARIGGNRPAEVTGQFIAAMFQHDTARPVDGYAAPQLHTHVVIFNMTERENGKMRALQERSFFESQSYATAIYQSHLTWQLRGLGYEIEPGKSGAPEIKGYSQEYLDASSPRRQQIVEAVARSGFSGPEAAQIAAHNTRDGKQILSPAEVMGAHRQISAEFGNQADKVVAAARERRQSQTHERPPMERTQQAHSAVTFARDRSFEREAVMDERAILVDAMRRGMGETTYPEVRANFEARVASGEFRLVASEKHSSGRQFTTTQTIKAENEIVRRVLDGQGSASQLMPVEQAIPLTEARPQLNQAQRNAIEQVLTSRDRIQGLQGVAGAGKTTTLVSIRQGAEQGGYSVEGFAPTGRAARQLRDAGIAADTLQGFLARNRAVDPTAKHLYMVDESSLASTQQMRDFLRRIGPHPVTQVSWFDANAFCSAYGLRLPTEFEWERAARMGQTPNGQVFKTGDSIERNGRYLINVWEGVFPLLDTGADGFRATSPVGAFGAAPSGLTDMAGNVWEWTSSWYVPYGVPERAPANGQGERVSRGGSFLCSPQFCQGYRASARNHTTPDTSLENIGFRCASDPEDVTNSAGRLVRETEEVALRRALPNQGGSAK